MAIEKPPKTMVLAAHKPWERRVNIQEIREREGTVDDKGIRHIFFGKDDSQATNNATVQRYKKLGYEVKDGGHELEMTISDETYRTKILADIEARGIKQLSRTQKVEDATNGEFTTDTFEKAPLTPEQILSEE